MSGGSYNYLLFLPDRIETLERMVSRLQELDAGPAVQEAQAMLVAIKSAKETVSDSHAHLSELFKAVEWLDSNDGDKEGVQEALDRYLSMREKVEQLRRWSRMKRGAPFPCR